MIHCWKRKAVKLPRIEPCIICRRGAIGGPGSRAISMEICDGGTELAHCYLLLSILRRLTSFVGGLRWVLSQRSIRSRSSRLCFTASGGSSGMDRSIVPDFSLWNLAYFSFFELIFFFFSFLAITHHLLATWERRSYLYRLLSLSVKRLAFSQRSLHAAAYSRDRIRVHTGAEWNLIPRTGIENRSEKGFSQGLGQG